MAKAKDKAKVPSTTKPSSQFKPYKFVVQAHLQKRDARGRVISEAQSEPVVLFGETLVSVARQFDRQLAKGLKDGVKVES